MSTLQARIHRAKGVQAVESVKAIHAYLHAVNYSREEWDTIWSKQENTTWAHGFGRMVGPEEIYYNSVYAMDKQMVALHMKASEQVPKEYATEWYGTDLRSGGCAGGHLLASPVIEVAEDGKTARSFYLTPGGGTGAVFRMADGMTGAAGNFLWERYGSDFVYEDGKWLYFHEQVCPDIAGPYDRSDWAHENYERLLAEPDMVGSLGGDPPKLSEPEILHYDFTPIQPVQDTVPPPEPYQAMDDRNTYAVGRYPD